MSLPSFSRRLTAGIKPWVWTALSTPLLIFFLHHFQLVDFHEPNAADLHFYWRGKRPAHPGIVLVTIDDMSLSAVGEWPWPRNIYAVFLDVLSRYKPRKIFFDVLFTETGPDPEQDKSLAYAIKKAGNVILPFFYASESPWRASFPIPVLKEAAQGAGFVNVTPDPDGRIRCVKAVVRSKEGAYSHPALLMEPSAAPPLDRGNNFWINYPGNLDSFRRISFAEVIHSAGTAQEDKLTELFSGRWVMVGHTATGTGDLKPTPYSPQEAGLVIQASALHTLLGRHFLRPIPEVLHFAVLILLSFIAAGLARMRRALAGLVYLTGGAAAYAALTHLLFLFPGWIVPLFVPLSVWFLSCAAGLVLRYVQARMEREMLERELGAAAEIQRRFLPVRPPEIPGLDFAYDCRFARQVGGDLVDWIDLGGSRFGFCVGDVSGKGMPAAIYMAKAISDFRSLDKSRLGPAGVCAALNHSLAAGEISGMFLTLCYGEIDLKHNRLRLASAGHEPAVVFHRETGKAELVKEGKGVPLGVFDGVEYEEAEIKFSAGDSLLLFTDGVRELRCPRPGEEFGTERIRKFLEEQMSAGAGACGEVIGGLFSQMDKYRRGCLPHDDRTVVCLKRAG